MRCRARGRATPSASCCIQIWNAARVLRVEGAEDLVELDRRRDLRRRAGAPFSGIVPALVVPGVSST